MKTMIDFCKKHNITLNEVKYSSTERYNNKSWATFYFIKPIIPDASLGEITIGVYDNNEYKEISFYHELGHCLVDYPNNYKDISEYKLEKLAWKEGLKIAKQNNIYFSTNALRWAVQQLYTYSNTVLCKNSNRIKLTA